ncbi:MAG: hypothetical protein KA792_09360 [Bacteroidales bacterium]|nr:hypothetical protein [Bacteroidales bacterium]
MQIILVFILANLLAVLIILFVASKAKEIITIAITVFNSVLSGILSISALAGIKQYFIFPGSLITGEIPFVIDGLSAWFIIVINLTFITGVIYGFYYLKAYKDEKANLSLHWISYILAHSALISLCGIQNSLAFLIAWEIMAISSFLLVIFEYKKVDTIKAGINMLIQSHIGVVFLTLGFIWVAFNTNSYSFDSITTFIQGRGELTGIILFLILFIGFSTKAGFIPFHSWLPYAHPAAPSHISGVMSGVIIKIGIYGILRMILLIKTDYIMIGSIILAVSVLSALYGVMLAIIQHNLKRLLAYHSIENIGIIGIGIGLGTIGLGTGNNVLISLGFAGALLHILNHSLFKSLLFYAAGNVYQATHTLNIEKLGGIIKRMPHTAMLFLIAALAICGLPPFNGFISEFLIYSAMFKGLNPSSFGFLFTLIFTIFGLVLVGGLALMCFTKAFGTVFLGSPREQLENQTAEAHKVMLFPMYLIAGIILIIGIFPGIFFQILNNPLNLFYKISNPTLSLTHISLPAPQLSSIGLASAGFILLSGLIYFIKKRFTAGQAKIMSETWGCGYVGQNDKMQYTGSSFIRTFRKLTEPLLLVHKNKKEVKGIFPNEAGHSTHPYDKLEKWLIDKPLAAFYRFFNHFAFIQNGKLQSYIIYGVIFLIFFILTPIIYDKIKILLALINHN